MDREKVIKGLGHCAAMSGDECRECPYGHECLDNDLPYGMPHLAADALALLKEQEAKEAMVVESTNVYTDLPIAHCPKCGVSLDKFLYGRQHEGKINYCPFCGQAIKWE